MIITLFKMSVSGAVIIMVIVLTRTLAINRLPKKTFLFLWGIALCRLLVPFAFSSPFSAYNLLGQGAEVSPSQFGNAITFTPPIGELPTGVAVSDFVANAVNVPMLIWLLGTLALAAYFTIAYFLCQREFQTSLPVQSDYVANWLAQQTVKRTITIKQSNRISAPLTYGIWKPIILMPKNTNWQDTKQIEYVLAHELVHIKRFDTAIKLLLTATLCIHWFNPLVWVMYILSNRDIELSCDETVIRFFGDTTKSAYARTLISMEESKSKLTPLCNNFSKNAIEERITAIMKMKKTSLLGTLVAMLLVVGITTGFATSAVAANANSAQTADEINTVLDKATVIDLTSSGEVSISAGQGAAQLLDYSELKQTVFKFTQGQKVQIGVNHISGFSEDAGSHSVKLIFQDSENHVIEATIGKSDKEEITFESTGTYRLIIQNDEQKSLWYSFTLK